MKNFIRNSEIQRMLEEGIQKAILATEKPLGYKEAAEHLGYTESTLRTKVSRKEIPAHLVHKTPDGGIYFFASEITQHIREF
jgi:hypothetical protein